LEKFSTSRALKLTFKMVLSFGVDFEKEKGALQDEEQIHR
jgi:hypothetical protein